jgi:hypothetical protein
MPVIDKESREAAEGLNTTEGFKIGEPLEQVVLEAAEHQPGVDGCFVSFKEERDSEVHAE